jgi:hypothetical protein
MAISGKRLVFDYALPDLPHYFAIRHLVVRLICGRLRTAAILLVNAGVVRGSLRILHRLQISGNQNGSGKRDAAERGPDISVHFSSPKQTSGEARLRPLNRSRAKACTLGAQCITFQTNAQPEHELGTGQSGSEEEKITSRGIRRM